MNGIENPLTTMDGLTKFDKKEMKEKINKFKQSLKESWRGVLDPTYGN